MQASQWAAWKADLARYEGSLPSKLLSNQGLWAIGAYRFGRYALTSRFKTLLRPAQVLVTKASEILTGIQIAAHAEIGPGFYIGHFGGIVIGNDVVIGSQCGIMQGVTIGQSGGGSPTLGDRVYLAPGSMVFGEVHVGTWTTVGANSVVVRDLPAGVVAVGSPARVISVKDWDDPDAPDKPL